MTIINNIDGTYFEFNGIRYFKNFTSVVAGNKLRILNVYDSKIELLVLTDFSQITLNGVIHTNVSDLQELLLPVIYAINMTIIDGAGISDAPVDDNYYVRRNSSWFVISALMTAYDNAVNWITTNGQNILDFIANANKKPIVSAIWTSLLNFDVKASQFPAGNNWYSATANEVILVAADELLDRIDLIGAFAPVYPDTLGLVGKITGEPASTELVVPPDYDPEIFFPIKQVIVKAGSTTPTDGGGITMTTETVYANGTGEPTEWVFSSNTSRILNSAGVVNATNPLSSSKAKFINNADVDGLDSLKKFSLSFDITLKANLGNSYIFINMFNASGQQMTSSLLLNNGDYGFNSASLVTQNIVINGTDFSFLSLGNFRQLEIFILKNFAGYTLDNIKFHVGSGVIPVPSSHTHVNLSALDRITDALINAWNNASTWVTTNGATLIAHLTRTDNPHQVTKAQVGLGDADNTSDANKPVSIATQTALNLKQNTLVSATNIKTINGATILGSGDLVIGAGVTLGETDTTAYRGDRGKTAYDHSQSAHAPSNAQKNSDITKAEIEAKLIGEITSHTHPAGDGNNSNYTERSFVPLGHNSTVISLIGEAALTVTGTLQNATLDSLTTSHFLKTKRVCVKSAATAGLSAQFNNGNTYSVLTYSHEARWDFYFGNESPSFVSDCRLFVGLKSSIGALGNIEPSTFTNCIGVGFDSTYSNYAFYFNRTGNSGGTDSGSIDLGVDFPKNTVSTDFYQFTIYTPKDSSNFVLTLKNTTTGISISHTVVLVNYAYMLHSLSINNNTTAAEVRLALGGIHHKTFY